jgi:membrane protease YdiL (CAAX protease family)
MHESFERPEDAKSSSNRTFGLVLGACFLLVALAPLARELVHGTALEPRWWALALALLLFLLALIRPAALAPLNRLWTRLGLLLYKIVNPLVLGLLFYGTVTPVGLLMRATGKDPLRLKPDPAAASYWIRRDPPGPSPESMKNQF